jgi:hypothetical protein
MKNTEIGQQRRLPFGPEALEPFTRELFDREEEKAARILWSILETQSPRKSDWSQVFSAGASDGTNYRAIDRALPKLDPKVALMRLFDPEVPFVLVDPTEIERPQAKNTSYVGRLSDGKTLGFWTIVFAQPYRGRAVPFNFGTYSEATISQEATSRNLGWRELVWEVRELVCDIPLVFDREFSAQRWLETMDEANLNYVIRLNTKSGVKLKDAEGEEIPLLGLGKGEKRHIRGAYYRGEVEVNVAGVWREGYREPLWVMGTLAPEELLETYDERMKLEQSFKDTKSLLNLDKVMNKERNQLEMTLALVLLAYGLGLSIGEEARDEAYRGGGEKIPSERSDEKGGLVVPLL